MLSSTALLSESFVYQPLAWCRNIAYNKGLLPVTKYNIPIIATGNLSIRGAANTPLVDYLFTLLQNEYKVAVLGHGHGRKSLDPTQAKTKGKGIEPEPFYLMRKKKPDRKYALEDSKEAVAKVLEISPETELFILDDAFHHRNIKAGLNILITEYRIPFYKDTLLPFGRLLEPGSGYKRADVIMVSECPEGITTEEKEAIISKINPLPGQKVYFSYLEYGTPYDFYTGAKRPFSSINNIVLLEAERNLRLMTQYVINKRIGCQQQRFINGNYFTIDDLGLLQVLHHEWELPILIREQESMRMLLYRNHLQNLGIPLIILPARMKIMGGNEPFDRLIQNYVSQLQKNLVAK